MSGAAVVVRSEVSPSKNYYDYRESLRFDFYFSCAYCSATEFEAGGIGFEIDHYLPQEHFPESVVDYGNLMYSCEKCNGLKGDFYSDEDLLARGCYVIRVDEEDPADHLEIDGENVEPKTNTGNFNIELLDLRRLALRRMRRNRLANHDISERIALGLSQLGSIKVERVREDKRLVFDRMKKSLVREGMEIAETLDNLLREYARSPFLDVDTERDKRIAARRKYLKQEKAIMPSKAKKKKNLKPS